MQEYFPFYTAAAISVMNHTSNIILRSGWACDRNDRLECTVPSACFTFGMHNPGLKV